MFREKQTTANDIFSDDMITDDSETAAKQHEITIGELGLILLQNNVCISLSSVYLFV